MNRISEKAEEIISRMRKYFQDKTGKHTYINEEPLRLELFTSEQMERYSKTLAQSHKLSTKRNKDQLLKRLDDNEKTLSEVHLLLTETLKANSLITPAGEWLTDNFYLIQDQIRTTKRHLPKGYSENLPQLTNGVTRVYDIALQIIAHSDGWIDMESLSKFISAYQTVTQLELGELWAIPIMLRLALIENLRRVATGIAIDRIDRNLADHWAQEMIKISEKSPQDLIITIAEMARSHPPLVSAFVAEITRQLSGKGPGLALALNWIEQGLSENGNTSAEMIFAENQKQAADQVSMRNSIGSLRTLSTMDWRDFVENHSIVEQILKKDPAQVYAKMDFTTRDRYRHVIEHVSKKSKLLEQEVATAAINLSEQAAGSNNQRTLHVGYYLVDNGLRELYKQTKTPKPFWGFRKNVIRKGTFFLYLSSISIITLAITTVVYFEMHKEHTNHILLGAIIVLSLISASQLALTLVNFFCTLWIKPRLLSRMDFSKGIPAESRTLVVIPVLLTSLSDIDELVDDLEVRFLANRDENLQFGLLTDFTDAPQENLPNDDELLNFAAKRIEKLNEKYEKTTGNLFFLFHRPRLWNPAEKAWMGYERKRGKLSDLNALLRGNGSDKFSKIVGNIENLQQIKYVITLDADTQLPHGAAWKLTASIAHPLNRAFYNEKKQRVTEGYGILQPRVTVSLPEVMASRYARLHGDEPGIDPYTRATSDVYQDMFAEGSFIGKGIYEVDIFEKALQGRFPENRILSHDLLEGCYTRSGLLSDVQLYEKYPGTYIADVKRRIRWIRGDWQIVPWCLPFVPDNKHHLRKNPLSALSRWKIFDNLRRSLVPIALTAFILLGWTLLGNPLFWTLAVSLIIVLPIFVTSIWDVFKKPKDLVITQHLLLYTLNTGDVFIKTIFSLICLPHEAYYNLRAIVLTCWRMLVSHKKLLQWNPAAAEERINKGGLLGSYVYMLAEPFLALAALAYSIWYRPICLSVAGPIIILWLITPLATWWTSLPIAKQVTRLSKEQFIFLRMLSRKTWGFFEKYVTAEDQWLPPDNFQESPAPRIAHRTSPTNIGLYLLSNLSAYDFGYQSAQQFLKRTQQTLDTIDKLQKYNGHLYNWYNTQSLETLLPHYVSTVDSGNLAGHLLTLKQGILNIAEQRITGRRLFEGLQDTFHILMQNLKTEVPAELKEFENILLKACAEPPKIVDEVTQYLQKLSSIYSAASNTIHAEPESPTLWWKQKLEEQLAGFLDDIKIFAPLQFLSSAPKGLHKTYGESNLTLTEIIKIADELPGELKRRQNEENDAEGLQWLNSLQSSIEESTPAINEFLALIESLSARCDEFVANVEWDFLYDKDKNLLTIGYKPDEHLCDTGFYDLLASEARLGIFAAIAQGKIPEDSWFALSRLLTTSGSVSVLLSWSGSMFEYLMPLLVMPTYENTLLDQTYKTSVRRQIEYGNQRGVPWGNSESEYNTVDVNSNYQYRAFGTPGLGLKRGLSDDLVVAPYASALALMVEPEKSCKNLEVMSEKGFEGMYGFYESVDYTPSRLQRGQSNVVIHAYMAHHQGMVLVSLAYLLLNKPMQKYFEAELQFQANLLLLQERIPKISSNYAQTAPVVEKTYTSAEGAVVRVLNTPNTAVPEIQLLSNGRYHVMVTNSGAGYSRWKDINVTRWREDGTRDNWGSFCYIRDVDGTDFWSNTYQPSLKKLQNYEASFSQSRADFRGIKNDIEIHTEIVVSAEDDIEMRRLNIINRSKTDKTLEITSYAEVVLASSSADLMQPAFSNLFVETELLKERNAILCTRRAKSSDEQPPWMFQMMSAEDAEVLEISYETDRLKFIGRGNNSSNPEAMQKPGPLSDSQGYVLDPIVAIRYKITIKAEKSACIDVITGASDKRESCQALVEKYQDTHHKSRVFELAWTHSQVVLRHINASEADAQLYGKLAGSVIFANPLLRANPAILIKNQRGQSALWGYSISGDLPIVLIKIKSQDNIQLVKQMVQAHSYWHLKGLMVDLVIWNEDHGGYRKQLQSQIQDLIAAEVTDKSGGIFVRAADQISYEDRVLFQTVARVILSDSDGTLEDHLNRKAASRLPIPYINVIPPEPSDVPAMASEELGFFNGYGGFNADGSEYIIRLDGETPTPAPWANVIANPLFGTVISESGQAYTWGENAHEFRLSPWNNDPICDTSGEAFYLRDEETGYYWSFTPLPRGGKAPYKVRHGMGYSVFEHIEDGIHSELWVYVDLEFTIKFTVLKIRNISGRPRRLSATGYVEWVLGEQRTKTGMHVFTELDPNSGAIFAKNPYNTEFSGHVGFFDVDERRKTFTCDRGEFIGRNGTLKNPDGMNRVRLSGKIGAALDPCAAVQITFDLREGEEREIIFRLGTCGDVNDVSNIVRKFRGMEEASQALEKVRQYWKHTVGALQIETPDAATNILANGWLTYQVMASRLWGRSGYYQSGGAFGFRDQLQDVLSLFHTKPELGRKQILLAASRQFKDGDVQHWWHPPLGRGVRTRCSDDYLWLPFVAAQYILKTGDNAVLDEMVPFLEGRHLNDDEESYYDLPIQSQLSEKLYEHCVKAIRHGFRYGEHGLPLMGTGDWNDGMDRVGKQGKGESVWLAFFLYDILNSFIKIAELRNDAVFVEECKKEAENLKANVNKNGWDGEWFRRAYFDNGTPLGSSQNEECRIDSLPQSWSVISNATDAERSKKAMDSAYKYLVHKDDMFISLLDPAFNKSGLDPGYIKGYVPGVRENGGQYTHAAIWVTIAFAKLGDSQRTWELLNILNPLNHSNDPEKIAKYKVEPYVIAADVYSLSPFTGHGGWTWYSGSASWMYRLITEFFLGIQQQGIKLSFNPCVPAEWQSFKVHYRFQETVYHIVFEQKNEEGKMQVAIDGKEQADSTVTLLDDGIDHTVNVTLFRKLQ